MEKENKNLKIMLIIFITLSVVLGGFILYDKVLKEDNASGKCEKESCNCEKQETESKEETALPEWAKYLLNQNITKIGYGTVDKNENYKWKDISKDQLRGYLEKLTNEYSLIKLHDYDGGCDIYCGLEIKYNNNEFRIYAGSIFFENDPTLLSLLEKDNYTVYNSQSNYDTWHYGYAKNLKEDSFDSYEITDYINGK